MKQKEWLYDRLVNQIPEIREKYRQKREEKGGRLGAWLYLAGLNLSYYTKPGRHIKSCYEEKYLEEKSESSCFRKAEPEKYAEELARFEVVSFDVFDTLVFRPFSDPSDLFFLMEKELEYPGFATIRREIESRARRKNYQSGKTVEVTLEEIYQAVEEWCGIGQKKGRDLEWRLQKEYCFANPYMKEVVSELCSRHKRVIAVSDMYLHAEQIREILRRCGYPEFAEIYVSCEFGCSKAEGSLYREVCRREGKKNIVHVGDNRRSDVLNAEMYGITGKHYPNVNRIGNKYRACEMSAVTGSLYRGIVNAHLHNGSREFSREYEYGYIYGGLFVTGYCRFIREYVRRNKIEKVLFLSRDGAVLKTVYSLLYPEEAESCVYAYWSRRAAAKMTAGVFRYDYFRRFLFHKTNKGYNLEQIFSSMELEHMLTGLKQAAGIGKEELLTTSNVEAVREFLLDRWKELLESYQIQTESAGIYYRKILGSSKSAAAVDIGWAGSGALALDYLANKVWKLDCAVTGILAGTNSQSNAEPYVPEVFLKSGKLVSYLYSQETNRDLWKFHDPGELHNLYWELLLGADEGSLQGFYPDGKGGVELKFKEAQTDSKAVVQIHRGILEFARQYQSWGKKLGSLADISGRDAYAPMLLAEGKHNRKFRKKLEQFLDEAGI